MTLSTTSRIEAWPSLALEAWSDTCATLHMWTQIVGKIRLAQSPWVNHSWHVTLYVTARGLTTSPIPYNTKNFQIDFDFISHELIIESSDGGLGKVPLQPQSVAMFYKRLTGELERLGLNVQINKKPNEIADPIRFDRDESHAAYDPDYENRFWRILVQADRIFKQFRARFIGKCSPVHFFWGAPDLAVTRFSGRRAPEHPGGVTNHRTKWRGRRTRTKSAAVGFGPGAARFPIPLSIPTPIPSLMASRKHQSSRAQRFTRQISTNSSLHTTSSANPNLRIRHFSIFCKPRMKRRRIWPGGIAIHWNVLLIQKSWFNPGAAPADPSAGCRKKIRNASRNLSMNGKSSTY
jgi:hypothetical protein